MTAPTLRARDLMTRDPISLTPQTRILDVYELFVQEEIHGAPVIGEDGIVYGVVSTLDLLRAVREALDPEDVTVEGAMTRELVMVDPDASASEVARTMLDHRIHRVLVGDSDRMLAGVITTFDLLRAITPPAGTTEQTRYGR